MNQADLQAGSSFRDQIATVSKEGKRVWLYPQTPVGRLFTSRTLLSIAYLIIFFGLPFIKIDGHPFILIDILHRKFILFGQIFWPQDFFIFGLGMVLFIVFIALFTTVFGRVFCGWACPQTIFMEMVFRKVEYWIEGDAQKRKRLDQASWNAEKLLKKLGKWSLFWMISFVISNVFLAYIIGIDELKAIITEPFSKNIGSLLAILLFTTVFFFVYLHLREQVCTTICPYGRMQSVLLDKNTIVVAYDHQRGEPRGKLHKNETRSIGDCINCLQCVKVCPTGIDIRNGTQLECINCTACIDACNNIMNTIGFPEGLIRFTSENTIHTKKPFRFTARMKAYVAVMILLLGAETTLLATRNDVDVSILRTPGQLFQQQPDHQLSNLYNYKLLNKTFRDKRLEVKPENFMGTIKIVGEDQLLVPEGGTASGSMFIYVNENQITKQKTMLQVGIYENGVKIETVTTSFFAPSFENK